MNAISGAGSAAPPALPQTQAAQAEQQVVTTQLRQDQRVDEAQETQSSAAEAQLRRAEAGETRGFQLDVQA